MVRWKRPLRKKLYPVLCWAVDHQETLICLVFGGLFGWAIAVQL